VHDAARGKKEECGAPIIRGHYTLGCRLAERDGFVLHASDVHRPADDDDDDDDTDYRMSYRVATIPGKERETERERERERYRRIINLRLLMRRFRIARAVPPRPRERLDDDDGADATALRRFHVTAAGISGEERKMKSRTTMTTSRARVCNFRLGGPREKERRFAFHVLREPQRDSRGGRGGRGSRRRTPSSHGSPLPFPVTGPREKNTLANARCGYVGEPPPLSSFAAASLSLAANTVSSLASDLLPSSSSYSSSCSYLTVSPRFSRFFAVTKRRPFRSPIFLSSPDHPASPLSLSSRLMLVTFAVPFYLILHLHSAL